MDSTRRAGYIMLPAALLIGLSGCALIEPSGSIDVPTALQSCAMGHTWNLNVDDLATQVLTVLTAEGVASPTVSASGTQALTWGTDGSVTMDTDYELAITAAPAADQAITVTQSHKGSVTGQAFINGDFAIPRAWDGSGLKVDTVGQLNDAALDPVPFAIPATDLDDSVGIEITCDGDTLTTHPRNGPVTQTWSKG